MTTMTIKSMNDAMANDMTGGATRWAMWPACLLAFGLHVSTSLQAGESPDVLSFADALHLAETRSVALLAEEASTSSSLALANAARRLPDPVLRLSVDNVSVDGPNRFSLSEDFMTMRSVGLAQTLVRSATRRARGARFEREADAARAMRAVRLSELRRQTGRAWFDVHYARRMLELVARQRDEVALQIDAAQAAYRSGGGTRSDVIAARSAAVRLDDRIQVAREAVENAVSALERWVGDEAAAPQPDAPSIRTTRLDHEALRRRPGDDPEVAWLSSQQSVARAELEIARQERRPDWSVSLMYGNRGDAYSDMVSLGVSVPLPWNRKSLQDQEIAARRAQAEALGYRRDELARARRLDVSVSLHAWRNGLERLRRYDETLVELAAERVQAALAGYRGAVQPLSAVLEARAMEIDTRIERLSIERDAAAAWVELEYLVPDAASEEPS